jgi:predicted RNase H-like nuclease (RuvC/YqgF family)
LASSPNGADKLKHEERQLLDKIRMLKENVETLNNNIGFFAKSKKADEFKLQIEQKINTANSQIEKLQADLKVLRTLKSADNRK